jgi:stage V sporulation protein S
MAKKEDLQEINRWWEDLNTDFENIYHNATDYILYCRFKESVYNKLTNKQKTQKGAAFMEILKISSKSDPRAVAKAMVLILKKGKEVEMHTLGAGAVNQAVKAAAIARGLVAPNGINIVVIPAFIDLEINGEEKTGIKLIVKAK